MMGLARINIPSVVIPGGVMTSGPDLLTLEQLGKYSAIYERGEIDRDKLDWAKENACPDAKPVGVSAQLLPCRSWQRLLDWLCQILLFCLPKAVS